MLARMFFTVIVVLYAVAPPGSRAFGEDGESSVREGMRLLSEEKFDAAYSAFLRAKKEYPEMVEIDFMLGLAANGKGDYAAAVTAFETAMEEMPSRRVKLELAMSYMNFGGRGIPLPRQSSLC